ncbi:thymidine kinase, cytosolic-like [Oscarella lobularis]|uniref:thymidine kinase, cytosolic-like n=1 Tax=Oscarella lobularis TaxID=121494 RepID=UPI003313E216
MDALRARMLGPWLRWSRVPNNALLGRQTRTRRRARIAEPIACKSIQTANMSMVSTPGVQFHKGSGQIQLILGPMFSGKTTELLRRMKRYEIAKHSCIIIKYDKDNRYSNDGISTHDQQVGSALSCSRLLDVKMKIRDYSVVGIDEAQFFPDVVEFCEELADMGTTVIVAALDGTFQRKPFGSVLNLIPLAENVVKLSAVCMNCFRDASFSRRLTAETKVEVIGGADKYMAVCRECYGLPSIQLTARKLFSDDDNDDD